MMNVLQVPASKCFAVTRFEIGERKGAGPACGSPLVSKPRTGKGRWNNRGMGNTLNLRSFHRPLGASLEEWEKQ